MGLKGENDTEARAVRLIVDAPNTAPERFDNRPAYGQPYTQPVVLCRGKRVTAHRQLPLGHLSTCLDRHS